MKTNNKNVVRLTESKLKQIIAEEVKKAMNEIGNTPFGQYMLGRTAARQKKYPDEDYISASKYADDRRHEYNMDDTNFQSGYRKQDDLQNSIDDYMLDEVYGELRKSAVANDIKRKKDDIKKDMHDLAYKSLPSYKKKVDDEENTKSKELKHQIRKKYSLNNPAFNKTNEAKSVVRLSEAQIKEMVKCALMEVVKENNLEEKFNGKGLATAALGATLALGSPNHAAAQDVNPKNDTTMTYQKSIDKMDAAKDKKTAQLDSIMKKSDDRAKDIKARMDGRAKEMKDRMDANKNKSSFNKQLDSTKSATPKIDHNVKK